MANRAYAGIWCRSLDESVLLQQLAKFLATVPLSASRPGFAGLTIRAAYPTEIPILEPDLRGVNADAITVAQLASEHLHADSAYETSAYWDMWVFDVATARWKHSPEPLEIACYGEDYDDGVFRELGHFHVDLGFEHLFTGHAQLLGFSRSPLAAPQHPEEQRFIEWMSQPAHLREYQEKTRENIRTLVEWMQLIERAIPVEKTRLWSEGEENFEARIEEILAVR